MRKFLKLSATVMAMTSTTAALANDMRATALKETNNFEYKITPVPLNAKKLIKKYAMWHPGCPVPLSNLAYLKLSYWGMDHEKHIGFLIVNRRLAKEVVGIFHEIYQQHFPIKEMKPIPFNETVAAHSTASFYCRANRSEANSYSLHSYGYAIDINPWINPYIKDGRVIPPEGKPYLDRHKSLPGMIHQGDKIYNIFTQHGWGWGGDYKELKDYMHFEKDLRKQTSKQKVF